MKNDLKPYQIKQMLIEQQLEVLHCNKFRITLKPRVAGLYDRNYGNLGKEKREAKGILERFWTAREVIEQVRNLEIENMKGCEVYITPLNDDLHYLVNDDGSPGSIKALIASGYRPALIQKSSLKDDGEVNYQSVLIVHKGKHRHEQSIANKLVMKINNEFGDKKFSGVEHPFRLAGFANKKEGKNNFFTAPISLTGAICAKANEELNQLRNSVVIRAISKKESQTGKQQHANLDVVAADDIATKAFQFHLENELRRAIERGDEIDQSKLDYRVVKNMRAMGFSDAQITSGLVFGSPNIGGRHANVMAYVLRTLDKSKG